MPIGLRELVTTALSIRRVVSHARLKNPLARYDRLERTCLILGNGPSLRDDIDHIPVPHDSIDTFAVGRFAESALYDRIRPRYYVFADPMFWSPEAPESTKVLRANLLAHIQKDTTWPMGMFVPFEAASFMRSALQSSSLVEVLPYNNVPLWGHRRVLHYFYDRGLGMPPAQNVLVTSLFIAIRLGYRRIVILGADHSWHETLALDSSNRVCLRDRHFYDGDVGLRPFTMDGSEDKIFTMDGLFFALGRMFEGYRNIAAYASTKGVEIVNASNTTYIDAFPRSRAGAALFEASR